MTHTSFSHLPDDALLAEAQRLVDHERLATVQLIGLLMELDARRLYLGEGYSSLFAYCTRVLHQSEHATYTRIAAARAARRFPVILDLLADGSINLTTVTLLAADLTPENHREVLESARHRSKREIQVLVAALHPKPPVPSMVRKLPAPNPRASAPVAGSEALLTESEDRQGSVEPPMTAVTLPPRPAVEAPLTPERYKIQFTVTRETYEKLRRARDLLRHTIPNGDPAEIFDRALTILLDDVARTKLAVTNRPRRSRPTSPGSRHIPAGVKRAVWARDGAQCAFVGTNGRCQETGFLELHHVVPYAAGGAATLENLCLRCAAHNKHEANLFFGSSHPSFVRESAGPTYGPDGNSEHEKKSPGATLSLSLGQQNDRKLRSPPLTLRFFLACSVRTKSAPRVTRDSRSVLSHDRHRGMLPDIRLPVRFAGKRPHVAASRRYLPWARTKSAGGWAPAG